MIADRQPTQREPLPTKRIGAVTYAGMIEVSCPPFTELAIYADGRQVHTQTCPDRAWAVRAYEAFLMHAAAMVTCEG